MHEPVLLQEVIEHLQIKPDGRYVDGTLGLGGHSAAIAARLTAGGRLLSCDVDADTLELAKDRLQPFGDRTITRLVNFRGLQPVLQELEWPDVDGMLFDLGVSSVQLDDGARGISFQGNAPLDMRLNRREGPTALQVLEQMDQLDLMELLNEFGEGRNAKRLSRAILNDVEIGKLKTTGDLAGLCERVVGRHGRTHPATKTFLALRCKVNDELGALRDLLDTAPLLLAPKGRLALISFHSLEDRMVKEAFKRLTQEGVGEKKFFRVTKKPLVPSEEEQRRNPRSRSAKLRVLERVK